MRHRGTALLMALGCTCLAGTAQAQAPSTAGVLPPALVALEQQAAILNVTSLRASTTFAFTGPSAGQGGVSEDFDERTLPTPQAQVRETESADHKSLLLRSIGSNLYAYDPGAARRHGGRPWLLSAGIGPAVLSESTGLVPSNAFEGTDPLASLLAALSPQDVTDVGPVTVNGAPATEFTLTPNLATLVAAAPTSVRSNLRKALETLVLFGAPPSVTLDVAADGIPVRTTVTVDITLFGSPAPSPAGAPSTSTPSPSVSIAVATDIVAINTPVSVPRPPANQTAPGPGLRQVLEGSF